MPTYLVLKTKSIFYAGIKMFTSLLPSLTVVKNDKAKLKIALSKYLLTHSFYSVDDFFACKNDLHFCKLFVIFYTVNLYICVFISCSTSYCLLTHICMYVYMYVFFFIYKNFIYIACSITYVILHAGFVFYLQFLFIIVRW